LLLRYGIFTQSGIAILFTLVRRESVGWTQYVMHPEATSKASKP